MKQNQQREKKKVHKKVWGKPDASFQGSFPSRDHRTHLILQGMSFDNTCEMLSIKEAHQRPSSQVFL